MKYYYATIENGVVKIPQELLDKLGAENGDTVEFEQIGDVTIQLSFVEAWDCPYGNDEVKEKCYKCHYHERCERTERRMKYENKNL